MPVAESFPYVEMDPTLGAASALPYAPVQLELGGKVDTVSALVDSGATLNVMPYKVGLQLGGIWDQQTIRVHLAGNLARTEARAILLQATIGSLAPVQLAFAWAQSDQIPVILGQVNFFMEFDVCFFRSQSVFEIKPLQSKP